MNNQEKEKQSLHAIFRKLAQDSEDEELRFLIDLVNYFRPKGKSQNQYFSIRALIDFLNENPTFIDPFRAYLYEVFEGKTFRNLLSDAGILQNTHFFQEIKKRSIAKILPFQPDRNTLEFVLNQIFYSRKDYDWLSKIPTDEMLALYELLQLGSMYDRKTEQSMLNELLQSMRLIMQRMSGRALETDVIKMIPEYENYDSPFEVLEKEFDLIEATLISDETYFLNSEDIDYKQINIILVQCEDFVNQAYKNSSRFGISLNVNQSLLRIRQQIKRLKSIFPYLVLDLEEDKKLKSVSFFLCLVKYNCMKNNVRKLINESTQLIAYEITQHTAKTGEHYITKGSNEYFNMLSSAIGGGVIVGILCVIKLLLSKVETSDFGHAILYSLNYAIGFTAIYLLGYTLATKQPAMTAAALIQSIEKDQFNTKDQKYKSFANLFARLFRSQFIAFVGNVIFAFPVALLIIYGVDYAFGLSIPDEKWDHLLTDLSPIHSAAIFHAAIAGLFLFLSGIISGSVSNSNKHNKLYFRIQENPTLKMSFGKRKTAQIAQWFERRWAGVSSNIWFGFFHGNNRFHRHLFGTEFRHSPHHFCQRKSRFGIVRKWFSNFKFHAFLGHFWHWNYRLCQFYRQLFTVAFPRFSFAKYPNKRLEIFIQSRLESFQSASDVVFLSGQIQKKLIMKPN